MFGAAVIVAPLSLSHLSQRNGEAANAAVGASQSGDPVSAPLSRKVRPISWYSGSQVHPTSAAGSTPKLVMRPFTLFSTASGDSCAVRGVPVDPAVPCSTAGAPPVLS